MSYRDTPLEGRAAGLGWGVWHEDDSTAQALLPKICATFEWIRPTQRVPERIHLIEAPEDVALCVGTTASVLVMPGTAESHSQEPVAAVPNALA